MNVADDVNSLSQDKKENSMSKAKRSPALTNEKKMVNGKEIALKKQLKFQIKKEKYENIKNQKNNQQMWVQKHSSFVTQLDDEMDAILSFIAATNNNRNNASMGKEMKKRKRLKQESEKKSSVDKNITNVRVDDDEKELSLNNYGTIKRNYYTRKSRTKETLIDLLAPYINLKEGPHLKKRGEKEQQLFIAEGTEVVRLLIQQYNQKRSKDHIGVELISILIKPCALFNDPVKLIEEIEQTMSNGKTSPPFHILIGSEKTLSTIAGFTISRGAMTCGIVPKKYNESWFWTNFLPTFMKNNQVFESEQTGDSTDNNHSIQVMNSTKTALRILALDQISNTSNLGSMIRTSAAFGISIILVSENSCDAWYRQSVRVSMGHIFSIPVIRVKKLAQTLKSLNQIYQIQTFASVVVADGEKKNNLFNQNQQRFNMQKNTEAAFNFNHNEVIQLDDIPKKSISKQWCCVMGNEANGLSHNVIQSCWKCITIGTALGVDSLSVPIATGILLHGLCERENHFAA